jgi:hypothetical protein
MKFNFQVVLALVLLWVIPLAAEDTKRITFKEIGFSITKPADWHFFLPLQEPLGQAKPDIGALLAHYSKSPVVALSKFPAEYAQDVNPNIRVTMKPVTGIGTKKTPDPETPEFILKGVIVSLERALPGFQVDEEPRSIEFSGHHGAFMSISYDVQLINGTSLRGNSDLWLVMPSGYYAFFISAVTRQDEANAKRADLRAIVKSSKIEALTP